MAMDLPGAGGGRPRPIINVTPLVDVVLVLLIIFMVVAPMLDLRLGVGLPAERTDVDPIEPEEQLVVDLEPDGQVTLNGEVVERSRLAAVLGPAIRARRDRTVFFRGDPDVFYGDAVRILDIVRGAGAQTIGTVVDGQGGRGGEEDEP